MNMIQRILSCSLAGKSEALDALIESQITQKTAELITTRNYRRDLLLAVLNCTHEFLNNDRTKDDLISALIDGKATPVLITLLER